MKLSHHILILTLIILNQLSFAGNPLKTSISGHVTDQNGNHIPFATISIKGTTIGTTVDQNGHFQLKNIPDGILTIKAQYLGYKPKEIQITIKEGETLNVQFKLEEDLLRLEEVVVTANRNETNRQDASTIVNSISQKLLVSTQSSNLSDGLNYCPGLRMESNCQNCGFSQVRINGMEGAYSQILINNRPIFSGLAGVYGLELIPSNMIERIEVIRGGGSALYGSNAIAGTINLILKDPINNSYEAGLSHGLLGIAAKEYTVANDFTVNMNASIVSDDHKSGISIYGFHRKKDPFDANADGFSETTSVNNSTIGTRIYKRFGYRSKLSADFFNIKEERRGGNKFDYIPHMTGITEMVDHNITTGALTYDQFFRETDLLSVFISGQNVERDSYYGAEQSLKDYGYTEDFSYSTGIQYNAVFNHSTLVAGIEDNGAWLKDMKMAYPDLENIQIDFSDTSLYIPETGNRIVANQLTHTISTFAQYDVKWKKFDFSTGLRYSSYSIQDRKENGNSTKGLVFSPRLAIKYKVNTSLQMRVSYAQGFRAPQIFDEDLHIETSAARKVIHRNDPNLEEERSHSFMASVDWNKQLNGQLVNVLIEGFYTRLNNAFVNDYGIPDSLGTVIYTRKNAKEGAFVSGINLELDYIPSSTFSINGGFTYQQSIYEEKQEFNEKRFVRTPNDYGFVNIDWSTTKKLALSATTNYTGKMLVPYFGMDENSNQIEELRTSPRFFDLGLKARYTIKLSGIELQVYMGIKNILNSYQNDFDSGINRDPGYTYGPMNPRLIYVGLKLGSHLL